jgi:hypothetical protein
MIKTIDILESPEETKEARPLVGKISFKDELVANEKVS